MNNTRDLTVTEAAILTNIVENEAQVRRPDAIKTHGDLCAVPTALLYSGGPVHFPTKEMRLDVQIALDSVINSGWVRGIGLQRGGGYQGVFLTATGFAVYQFLTHRTAATAGSTIGGILTETAEGLNSISDNVAHWSPEQTRQHAQDLRVTLEQIEPLVADLLTVARDSLDWLASYPGGNASNVYLRMTAAIDAAEKVGSRGA